VYHRCFLSGVSVPLSPSRSRIVEAVCILLCQKYPESQMSSGAGKVNGLKYFSKILLCRWPEKNLPVQVEANPE